MTSPRLYAWDPSFAIGLDQIDEEHKGFFDILNELYGAIIKGDPESAVQATYARLKRYAANHFATEERLFAETRYAEAEAHVEQHRAFVASLASMEPLTSASAREMISFMRDWLIAHILRSDRRFGRFVAEAKAKAKAA